MLSLPPDPALWEYPAVASLCFRASVSTLASRLPVDTSFLQRAREIFSVLLQPLLIHSYRLVVHSCCPVIGVHSLTASQQPALRSPPIYQTEPLGAEPSRG